MGSGWGNPRGKLERWLRSEELAVRELKITHFLHLRRRAGNVCGDATLRSPVQELLPYTDHPLVLWRDALTASMSTPAYKAALQMPCPLHEFSL